jgi:flagellar assembly protein FliH
LSKKFVSEQQMPEPVYEFVWPSLGQKEYAPALSERQKQAEAKVLKDARDKAQFIEKEAYEQGFAQGEKDGREIGEKRAETVVAQIRELAAGFQSERERAYCICEEEMLHLVLSLARKIIHDELQTNERAVLGALREASKHVIHQSKMTIRLNPADHRFFQTHPEAASSCTGGRTPELIPDTSISRGGCIVQTVFGEVDGTIESQIDYIVSLLWKRFKESEPT